MLLLGLVVLLLGVIALIASLLRGERRLQAPLDRDPELGRLAGHARPLGCRLHPADRAGAVDDEGRRQAGLEAPQGAEAAHRVSPRRLDEVELERRRDDHGRNDDDNV
ncbi:hypothetical protein G5V59_15425 [Nocardioides sp. W3-2-3]|uniref:hypothetical protein n=1 Tax=Nocardioides convexus TaxID=2712224 RepID=UPI0024183EB6|nr:hypothetical protein [Nocardioides convexus]NHA00846.1 hypothetical protein [Nocardioides convexus]